MDAHASKAPLRVVFYSHDSQGLGHFRRNRALAHCLSRQLPALTGRTVTGLLVNGLAGGATGQLPAGFDLVTLPSVGKDGWHYTARQLDVELAPLLELRRQIFAATVSAFAPDLVVVDRHALGIKGELEAGLRQLRDAHPHARIVLGMREVLDEPSAVQREWRRTPPAVVRDLFDQIWVYGDPEVHDPRATGEIPDELHELVSFQGYLAQGRSTTEATAVDGPFILTTAGGGSDGLDLCLAAARAEVPEGHQHLVVTGPQMPEADHEQVVRAARGRGLRVLRQTPDVPSLVQRCAAVISMAGYNTVTETMATDVPSLLVPREWPRREQLIRAQGLQTHGMADVMGLASLSSEALAEWARGAVGRTVDRRPLARDGLRRVACSAAQLVGGAGPRQLARGA